MGLLTLRGLSVSLNIKQKLFLVLLVFCVCLLIFIGYRLLYAAEISSYGKELIAGCLGAVITIFATYALLKSQTDSEITKNQLEEIFKEKLKIYSEFITFLNQIHTDGELNHQEMKELVEWAAKLSLICRVNVIQAIYEFAFQVFAFRETKYENLNDEQKAQWKLWMLETYDGMEEDFKDEEFCQQAWSGIPKIISYLRDDIALKKMSAVDENIDMAVLLNQIYDLHSADAIELEDDGSYSIVGSYEEEEVKPKPRTRARK